MKIFNWMQTKLNRNQGSKKPNSISANHHMLQEPHKEEFCDWPHGLLAIGTFGKNDLKEDTERSNRDEDNLSSSQDHLQDLTPEEVGKLQNELNLLFHKQVESTFASETEAPNLQLDKFLNRQSSLESERTKSNAFSDESNTKSSTSVFHSRGKDVCSDNAKGAIGKQSLSFLLKKMFVCRNGFALAPSLRDPVLPVPAESRMEKILRAILHMKIHPQSSSSTLSTKKYLENRHMSKSTANEDELNDKADNGSKWVKTDSEYIVLEI